MIEIEKNEYDLQAENFLLKNGIKFSCKFFSYSSYFQEDKEKGIFRDVYKIYLSRNGKRVSFIFGQSINATEKGEIPGPYDLFSCITKNDPGDFENFCYEFGYNTDSRAAEKIFISVKREWKKVSRFFTDGELKKLQEIN